MSFGKRVSKPMTLREWSWVLTSVLFATLIVGFAAFVDWDETQAHYADQYSFTTVDGKTVSSSHERIATEPYRKLLTIETNGDMQKIIQAVHDVAPDSFIVTSSNLPDNSWGNYLADWFGCILTILTVSYLFRVVEKIFLRILGGGDNVTSGIKP
jgi:hypothetical protein